MNIELKFNRHKSHLLHHKLFKLLLSISNLKSAANSSLRNAEISMLTNSIREIEIPNY